MLQSLVLVGHLFESDFQVSELPVPFFRHLRHHPSAFNFEIVVRAGHESRCDAMGVVSGGVKATDWSHEAHAVAVGELHASIGDVVFGPLILGGYVGYVFVWVGEGVQMALPCCSREGRRVEWECGRSMLKFINI